MPHPLINESSYTSELCIHVCSPPLHSNIEREQHKKSLLATIKTHGSVSYGPRSLGHVQTGVSIITGTTKLRFSHIHRSVTLYQKITKFAVELPAYKGRLDSKIEVNRARCFRDTRDQSFSFCSSFFFFFLFFFFSFFVFSHKSQNRP